MKRFVLLALALGLGACGTTSYGASTDGVFPARSSMADYPTWEHMCVAVTKSNTTETLNDAGTQGWELATAARQGTNDLLCFKRPKDSSARAP